ncbi:MAG TPA: TIGR00282 family metallophosphoesterase [Deltaproteobacteria bacterium]|nr:TIGR00282 family metallophosphoesterase [Deltaproteobacteria bacterium]
MPNDVFTVLYLGDIIGKPGRLAAAAFIKKSRADFKIVNGENLAGGLGITPSLAMEMLSCGVDAISTGNHVWRKKEIVPYLMAEQRVIRPLNYPPGTPGFGYTLVEKNGKSLYLVCLEGRTFMGTVECPFRATEEFLQERKDGVPTIVDFHAEATSEKIALGWFLDGRVSVVLGTHTHVQTADERVLPKGTGYITDIGMTGATDSVIGMEKGPVLARFLTQMPHKYEVAKGDIEIQGVYITIDSQTGMCRDIQRIREKVE